MKIYIILLLLLFAVKVNAIELKKDNMVALAEEVTTESVMNTILDLESKTSPIIYLVINSPGGSMTDGIGLVQYLQTTKKPIQCIAKYAASMAHYVLESCPIRLGTSTNILLQHKAFMNSGGSLTEVEGKLTILRGLEEILNKMEAKRVGITLNEIREKTTHPWVTFGEESVKQGLLDKIVDVTCSSELYKEKNSCPLLDKVVDNPNPFR